MSILLQEQVLPVAQSEWREEDTKLARYYLSVNAMTRLIQVWQDETPYGEKG